MARPDARHDYTHFPREYTDLLVAFERDGRVELVYPSQREASAARRDLYRFKTIAANTLTARPTDTQAAWITDTFNAATLRVEAVDGSTDFALVMTSNPIVRAIRAGALRRPEPRAEEQSCYCPATPGEPCPLTTEECALRVRNNTVAAQTHTGTLTRGCRHPAACRSTIHGAPAFCACAEEDIAS